MNAARAGAATLAVPLLLFALSRARGQSLAVPAAAFVLIPGRRTSAG